VTLLLQCKQRMRSLIPIKQHAQKQQQQQCVDHNHCSKHSSARANTEVQVREFTCVIIVSSDAYSVIMVPQAARDSSKGSSSSSSWQQHWSAQQQQKRCMSVLLQRQKKNVFVFTLVLELPSRCTVGVEIVLTLPFALAIVCPTVCMVHRASEQVQQ
jgi:hypothetical protein